MKKNSITTMLHTVMCSFFLLFFGTATLSAAITPVDGKVYKVKNANSARYLNMDELWNPGASDHEGSDVVQLTANNGSAVRFNASGDGWTLQNTADDKYLRTNSGKWTTFVSTDSYVWYVNESGDNITIAQASSGSNIYLGDNNKQGTGTSIYGIASNKSSSDGYITWTLKPCVKVTYNYVTTAGGTPVSTSSKYLMAGENYPEVSVSEGYEYVSGKPEGTVSEDEVTAAVDLTKEIVVRAVVKTTLWHSQKDVLPTYRIPAIAKAKNGNLIAFSDKRYDGIDIGWTSTKRIDIIYKVSTDNGAIWSEESVANLGNDTNSGWNCAFGDAAVVADNTEGNETDEILIMSVAGTVRFSDGSADSHNVVARNVLTLQNGVWTPGNPEDQSSIFYGSNLFSGDYSMFIGAGKLCQSKLIKYGTHNRVYAALLCKTSSGNVNRTVFSDDFGKTWKLLGSKIALSSFGCDEPKIEELPDGRVILSSRVANGRYYSIFTYSDRETGTGSWSNVQKTNFSSSGSTCTDSKSTNGEMLVVPAKKVADGSQYYVVLQSLPNSSDNASSGRKQVCIKYKAVPENDVENLTYASFDNWDGSYQVSTTYSAYSTMTLDTNNDIAFYYEENQYTAGSQSWADAGYDMQFRIFGLSTITGGAYVYNKLVPTGISEIAPQTADSPTSQTYNLAGQKVSPNAKGIVVINGKKIIR